MRTYLLVYDKGADLQALRDTIDNHPDILNWSKAFPNSYFLVSKENPSRLVSILTKPMNGADFMITHVDPSNSETNGLMGDEEWDFIISPAGS